MSLQHQAADSSGKYRNQATGLDNLLNTTPHTETWLLHPLSSCTQCHCEFLNHCTDPNHKHTFKNCSVEANTSPVAPWPAIITPTLVRFVIRFCNRNATSAYKSTSSRHTDQMSCVSAVTYNHKHQCLQPSCIRTQAKEWSGTCEAGQF